MDQPTAQRAVLLLFPTERVATFVEYFTARGYETTVLSLDRDDRGRGTTGTINVSLVSADDLGRLGAGTIEHLLLPQIIIHDVGRDVLAPEVVGEGPDWRIDRGSRGQVKTEAANWILERLSQPARTLWVNVFVGEHDGQGARYCSGRYGLEGFGAAVRLAPRLASLAVLNLCVTYFSDPDGSAARCPYCLTAIHAPAIRALGGDLTAAARFVERRHQQLGPERDEPAPREA